MTSQPAPTIFSGWGRYPRLAGHSLLSEDLERISNDAVLCRGLGRSYGDSALPADPEAVVADTTLADRLLHFDRCTGRLRAEAGLSLRELNRIFLPQRWFVPVSPGTQMVTLGGMVAADVHGKNQHIDGCFGHHVEQLRIRVGDGRIVECSPTEHVDLFRATIGGMGLTGHILEVAFRMQKLPSPWILQQSERVQDLDAMIEGLKHSARDWPMTVGWLDCLASGRQLGRGILIKGRWATADEAPAQVPPQTRRRSIPRTLPEWVLGRWSMKAFNQLYYWRHVPRRKQRIVPPQQFFYPLDTLDNWNLVYGDRGLTQYQCVLPHTQDNAPARRLLELFRTEGGASFLCVIKDCGRDGAGMMSFPRPGISIAVDFPVDRRRTPELVDRLNEFVLAAGGRIYLAKDAFSRPEHVRAMYPQLAPFNAVRRRWDPQGRFRSAQSVRLLGDGESGNHAPGEGTVARHSIKHLRSEAA